MSDRGGEGPARLTIGIPHFASSATKDVLLLTDIAEMFALPNSRAALRFLRENALPLVKLGRRLVVVRASLVDELAKRSRVEDRGADVAAVVRRLSERRRRSSIIPISASPGS